MKSGESPPATLFLPTKSKGPFAEFKETKSCNEEFAFY